MKLSMRNKHWHLAAVLFRLLLLQ